MGALPATTEWLGRLVLKKGMSLNTRQGISAAGGRSSGIVIEASPVRDGLGSVCGAAVGLLAQCAAVVETVGDAAYRAPSRTMPGGTIGKHVRHVLDHFRAALECDGPGGCIDYDHRERDVPMETDRSLALAAIDDLAARLSGLEGIRLASPVRVRLMVAADGMTADLGSTLARELAFAAHHAVHHQAMVRAIAAEFGCDLPADLGRAPSTLNHERRLSEGRPAGC